MDEVDCLHYYDVANERITFWGDEFAMEPILAEVERIWHLTPEMNRIGKQRAVHRRASSAT